LQNEWKTKKLNILLGLRLDKHNLINKAILSPRINVRYNPIELVNIRASYASGFRAPQAFDEDLHITAVGGDVQLIELDPNLKPEKSNSFSLSTDLYKDFSGVQTNVLVEGFYTNINDVFYLQETGVDGSGNTILTRTNGLGAVVKGINIEGKIVPSVKLNFQGGYTIQQSLYKEAQTWSENLNIDATRQMFRSPDQYGYFTVSYLPLKPLSLSLTGTYTGTMLVQHYGVDVLDNEEVWTPDFFDMNFKVSYDFNLIDFTKLQLNAGIQNVFNSYQSDFDIGETRDAGYVYGPSLPRSFFVGAKLSL
jgi:outer membrane receptor for ferrienterochelin and colicins